MSACAKTMAKDSNSFQIINGLATIALPWKPANSPEHLNKHIVGIVD